jgi:thiamine-monophosphate kinase
MAELEEAEAWCLGGGEDFELVLALERTWAQALVTALPGSGVIGSLVAGPGGEVGWFGVDGGEGIAAEGYRHFG